MAKRQHISTETKLAATLLQLRDDAGNPLIPYCDAKLMSADQICSLYNFDHYPIPKANGGSDHPSNMVPLGIMAHRKKTAEVDVPQIRKADRLAKAKAALDTFLATGEKPPVPPSHFPKGRKIAARADPWPPKGSRPLRSRSSFERRTP